MVFIIRFTKPDKECILYNFHGILFLIVKSDLFPADTKKIFESLKGLQDKLTASTHYANSEDRRKNIDLTIGLIQNYFVKREPSTLQHGPGLALDFENSILRSKIETACYEFKQGFLQLDATRVYDNGVESHILKTICGMANIGPSSTGYIYIGVADKEADSRRIIQLDSITPIHLSDHYIVGIERETKIMGTNIENYCRKVTSFIINSTLSEPLKTQVASKLDVVSYKNYTIIRIVVSSQKSPSYLGDDIYIRKGNNTLQITLPKEIAAIISTFNKTQ